MPSKEEMREEWMNVYGKMAKPDTHPGCPVVSFTMQRVDAHGDRFLELRQVCPHGCTVVKYDGKLSPSEAVMTMQDYTRANGMRIVDGYVVTPRVTVYPIAPVE